MILGYLCSKLPKTQARGDDVNHNGVPGRVSHRARCVRRDREVRGHGAALPITGFANSVVSPAMEFKREGFVLGVSARMFQVAGPVIVYGSLSALVVSILRLYVFR